MSGGGNIENIAEGVVKTPRYGYFYTNIFEEVVMNDYTVTGGLILPIFIDFPTFSYLFLTSNLQSPVTFTHTSCL